MTDKSTGPYVQHAGDPSLDGSHLNFTPNSGNREWASSDAASTSSSTTYPGSSPSFLHQHQDTSYADSSVTPTWAIAILRKLDQVLIQRSDVSAKLDEILKQRPDLSATPKRVISSEEVYMQQLPVELPLQSKEDALKLNALLEPEFDSEARKVKPDCSGRLLEEKYVSGLIWKKTIYCFIFTFDLHM